jgi:predicted alpha/beta hydrolase
MARAVLGSLDLLIIPLVVAWVCGAAFAANFRYVAVRALAGVILVSAVGVVEYFYMGLLVTTGANGYPAAPFDYDARAVPPARVLANRHQHSDLHRDGRALRMDGGGVLRGAHEALAPDPL